MGLPMKESIIAQVPLFASLPEGEIHHLEAILRPVDFAAQSILIREGEYGDRFYVVVTGQIDIVKAIGTPEERLLGTRGRGEYAGEMGLLNPDGKRTASVRARTRVRALEMTRQDFDLLLQRQPRIAYELTRVLSARLAEADNATIRDLQDKNRQLQAAFDELRAAHAQIVEKEKLERELQVARQIQESILPRELPELAGFDFGARMIPTRAVGGDFFDLVSIDAGHVGIAVADVSDKGVPAAIFMALTRSLLRAEAMRTHSPRRVLEHVNDLLLDMNAADMFVTMLYGVLDGNKRTFRYARAGHPTPLVFGAHNRLVLPALKKAPPLAIYPSAPLDVQCIQLASRDMLVLFTDGITEAMNEQDELFGAERLIECGRARRGLTAQSLCDRLVQDVNAYRGPAPQSDDITIVAVRVR